MTDFYNDNDRHAAAWLRELIGDGHLPEGTVDERSVQEIVGTDLEGFRQVHLFAGIGGWAYALQLAGWPATRPVWTGSCPCQPFSAAGKRKGSADERHLWPVFLWLIRECQPATIFGEQVASDDGYRWLARVRDDLEEAGYAVGCADLPACSAGAPIIRQRLWFVASARFESSRQLRRPGKELGQGDAAQEREGQTVGESGRCRESGSVGSTNGKLGEQGSKVGSGSDQGSGTESRPGPSGNGVSGDMVSPGRKRIRAARRGANGEASAEVQANNVGWERLRPDPGDAGASGITLASADGGHASDGRLQRSWQHGQQPQDGGIGFWDAFDIVACLDGKSRRVEPGTFPLASGLSGRMGRLRGYGNSIVPQVAAKFIRAFLEAESEV